MKKIECVIQPDKVAIVEQALRDEGIGGMTVSEVKGFGRQRMRVTSKVKLEIYALEAELEWVIKAITRSAYSGKVGDGKIAVLPMEDAIRIRTQEHGAKALL